MSFQLGRRGFKLSAGFDSALIKGGSVPGVDKRLVPSSADQFYVNVGKSWGAVAFRFQRNIGGSDSIDIGTPWQPFRRVGAYALESVATAPTSPDFTYDYDIGSHDYALQRPTPKTGGSYHGGETVVSETIKIDGVTIDPTVEQSFTGTFETERSTLITYPDATTAIVDYLLRINADGSLFERTTVTSSASFTRQHLQMEIAALAFRQAIIDNESNPVDIKAAAEYDFILAADVTLRSPQTGHTIRNVSMMPTLPEYEKTYVLRTSSRSKLYFRRQTTGGNPLGSVTVERTVIHDKGAPDSAPTSFTETFAGDSLSEDWTVTFVQGTPTPYSVSGGELNIDGLTGANARFWQPLWLAPGNYTIQADARTDTAQNTGGVLIGSNGSSMTSPIMAQISFNGTSKATYSGNFTVDSNDQPVLMLVNSPNTGRNSHIDEVRIFPTP